MRSERADWFGDRRAGALGDQVRHLASRSQGGGNSDDVRCRTGLTKLQEWVRMELSELKPCL